MKKHLLHNSAMERDPISKNRVNPKNYRTGVKFFLALFLLTTLSLSSFGQWRTILPKEKYLEGGKQGKSYQIGMESAVGKKEIVEDFVQILDYFGICDYYELKPEIDKMDDQTTDFTVDFILQAPMYPTRMMGMSVVDPAIVLSGNVYFEFKKDSIGKPFVNIDFKNWDELMFLLYNDAESNFNIQNPAPPEEKKGFFQQLVDENLGEKEEKILTPKELAFERYNAYKNKMMTENTILYKALSVAVGAVFTLDPTVDHKKMYNDIKNVLSINYKEKIAEEYPMYDTLFELKLGDWFTDVKHLQYFRNMPVGNGFTAMTQKNKDGFIDMYTKHIAEEKFMCLTQNRWEKQVRPLLEGFFKMLSLYTESKIMWVAEDSYTTYTPIGGLLLPPDPKWATKEDGTPIPPWQLDETGKPKTDADAKLMDKYIKKNSKNAY